MEIYQMHHASCISSIAILFPSPSFSFSLLTHLLHLCFLPYIIVLSFRLNSILQHSCYMYSDSNNHQVISLWNLNSILVLDNVSRHYLDNTYSLIPTMAISNGTAWNDYTIYRKYQQTIDTTWTAP